MSWRRRQASSDDCDRLALVGSATFFETFAGVLDGSAIVTHCQRKHGSAAYREYLASGSRAWIAETDIGDAPIGYSLLGPPNLPGGRADGSDVELKRIYTLSRFHGSGIGAAIMQQATLDAARQGATRLLLGVYAGNARARAFYLKSGFVQIGERRFNVGENVYDDVVLALTVSSP